MKQIGTTIDDETLRDFKENIVRKYGRLWGFYREELGKAIKERTEKLKGEYDESAAGT